MAKRKIVRIDEDKCNGCGNCITGCAEGALRLVDGKARLVKEQFCDGFGDCIGTCPTGALTIEEREADAYDEQATKAHLRTTQGEEAVRRMEAANAEHEAKAHAAPPAPPAGGCPGMRMRMPEKTAKPQPATRNAAVPGHVIASGLQQWPVQLHLVQPGAPFFRDRELVVLGTCGPVASADIHWRFLRGRSVVVACPKLDRTEPYADKLGAILRDATIPKVIVVRMAVPCCGGLTAIVRQAAAASGRTDLEVEEVTIGLDGDILGSETIA